MTRNHPAHERAAAQRRRLIAHCDANLPGELLGRELSEWLPYRFEYIDSPGSCVDTVVWDMPQLDADPAVVIMNSGVWVQQGIDVLEALVAESRRRGKEVFWNHRISEVDLTPQGKLAMDARTPNPAKAHHPERIVRSWWWQGLWNLQSEWVKTQKLTALRARMRRYDFHGLQIDFSRYTPCLPVGREWENRGHVTDFVRRVREMLFEEAERFGAPILLAVKVPRNMAGCRNDGFDVATWVNQGLIDILVPGCRSIDVDVRAFVELTAGSHVGVYPCLDDHHGTDAYLNAGVEFFRGVFVNWLSQGASGVQTLNWTHACAATHSALGVHSLPPVPAHHQVYQEAGNVALMRHEDRLYAAERRGGFLWTGGFFCSNRDAALPAKVPDTGARLEITLSIYEDLASAAKPQRLELRLILFNAQDGDAYKAEMNGVSLALRHSNHAWKDPQIYAPLPQPPVGWEPITDRPDQRLTCLVYDLPLESLTAGTNRVSILALTRMPYIAESVSVEKAEVLFSMQPGAPRASRWGSPPAGGSRTAEKRGGVRNASQ